MERDVMKAVADLWSIYLKREVSAEDVAVMLSMAGTIEEVVEA